MQRTQCSLECRDSEKEVVIMYGATYHKEQSIQGMKGGYSPSRIL